MNNDESDDDESDDDGAMDTRGEEGSNRGIAIPSLSVSHPFPSHASSVPTQSLRARPRHSTPNVIVSSHEMGRSGENEHPESGPLSGEESRDVALVSRSISILSLQEDVRSAGKNSKRSKNFSDYNGLSCETMVVYKNNEDSDHTNKSTRFVRLLEPVKLRVDVLKALFCSYMQT